MQRRSSSARARFVAVAVLALGALAVLMLWPRRRPTPAHEEEPSAAPPDVVAEPLRPAAQRAPELLEAPFPKPKDDGEGRTMHVAPLIAEVALDKRRACPGETIEARMRQRPEVPSPVQYTIPGYASGDVAIVSFDEPGTKTINVVASDGIGGVEYRAVEVEIVDPGSPECTRRLPLAVTATLSNSDDDSALIRVVPPARLKGAVRYAYDFGDGTSEGSTQQTALVHKYTLRAQTEPSSTFVVQVRAVDEAGARAEGRASINFRNVHWLSGVVGSPMMPTQYDRFAKHRSGTFTTELTLKNIEQAPIELTRARAKIDACRGQPAVEREYPISQVAPALRRVEPGQAAESTLALPESDLAGACRVLVVLEGDTVPPRAGKTIGPNLTRTFDSTRANVALELAGPPLEGALPAAAPVRASEEMARVLDKATAILGPNHPITPEDLRRLKREGLLD